MSDALTKALLRRERILMRVARQREDIGLAFAGLAGPIALIDRIANAGRLIRAHPAAVAVLVAALVAMRGRTLIGVVTRAFSIWRLARQVRSLVSRFGI